MIVFHLLRIKNSDSLGRVLLGFWLCLVGFLGVGLCCCELWVLLLVFADAVPELECPVDFRWRAISVHVSYETSREGVFRKNICLIYYLFG